MKKILYTIQVVLMLLLAHTGTTQTITAHGELDWKHSFQHKFSEYNMVVKYRYFQDAVFPYSPFLPVKHILLGLDPNVRPVSVQVDSAVYVPIDSGFLFTQHEYELIAQKPSVSYHLIPQEGGYTLLAEIIPFRFNPLTGLTEKMLYYRLVVQVVHVEAQPKAEATLNYPDNSVLTTGRWFKFGVKENGIYRITFDDLRQAGLDPTAIDPRNIRIYGKGGGMLPESNAALRYNDLPENSIMVVGEEDGVFGSQDYILFFGESPHIWNYTPTLRIFNYVYNIYSDYTYYFLTPDLGRGKRITEQPSSTSAPNRIKNHYTELRVHDLNEVNLIRSGREWYGEEFDATLNREFVFDIPNRIPDSTFRIRINLAARSFFPTSFALDIAGTSVQASLAPIPVGPYQDFARETTINRVISSALNPINVNITYNKSDPSAVGWLNHIQIQAPSLLRLEGDFLLFRNPWSVGHGFITEFRVDNAPRTDVWIWDVTDGRNVVSQQTMQEGNRQIFRTQTNVLREFAVFKPAAALKPVFSGVVENQNLHGLPVPQMIIITHPDLLGEANRLAEHHRNFTGLTVLVETVQRIYNEFSSGAQDVAAIRDFVRMMHKRQPFENHLRYLLLFGDPSYDYKDKTPNNNNMVPCWQSPSSLHPISSYAMDDFFGYLEDHEGDRLTDNLDIGIGRLTVTTPAQARAVVDKIIHYATNISATQGEWRNTICFIADDEDGNLHVDQAEQLVETIQELRPEMNIDKIFIDAYQQLFTPGGQRYPDVNADINSRVERGALVVNYTGHGGVNGWALERILEKADINSWRNINSLPLFITATCEFAYYDDPDRLSAGELVLLNPNGGGIALFTTTRPTFAGPNLTLNRRIFEAMFAENAPDDLRLGDIIRLAKLNITIFENARKFVLIGDPATQLAIPSYRVFTTHFNNSEISFASDTLRALSMVTINGFVGDKNGQILNDFNGVVIPTVFDKPVQMSTNANDGGEKFPFQLQQNILYRGKSSVVNGAFSFSFIVPRDIAYQYGPGRISYYAFDSLRDAHGSTNDLFVGGFNAAATADTEGPLIELYINDPNFRHGGITGENPVLFAVVSDESGINTSGSGIGHDITATLNDEVEQLKVLNRYYTADLNTFQRGTIRFPFFNLPDGTHTLRLKVWDVHNNSSEATTEFVVASSASIALEQVLNAPNPFRDQTRFYLEHNMGGQEIEVDIQIFSFDGRLRKRLGQKLIPQGFRSEIAKWDGRDDSGNILESGIYIYRVLVRNANGQTNLVNNKLIIIR